MKRLQNLWTQLSDTLKADIKLRIAAIGSILAVVALMLYIALVQPQQVADALIEPPSNEAVQIESLQALSSQNGLISAAPVFKLIAPPKTALASLEKSFTSSPKLNFAIKAISETEYEVTPTEPLQKGSLLKLSYNAPSGETSRVYQVSGNLTLKGTYPVYNAKEVPLNTGIELSFSESIDEGIIDHISIRPEVEFSAQIQDNLLILTTVKPLEVDTQYVVTLDNQYKTHLDAQLLDSISLPFFTGTEKAYEQGTQIVSEVLQVNEPRLLQIQQPLSATEYHAKIYPLKGPEALTQELHELKALAIHYMRPEQHMAFSDNQALFDGPLPAFNPSDYVYERFVQLPELAAGAYRIVLESAMGNQITYLQVTPFATYLEYDDTRQEGLLWALDAKTSAPLSATLTALEDPEPIIATTDAKGTATFKIEKTWQTLILSDGDHRLAIFNHEAPQFPNFPRAYAEPSKAPSENAWFEYPETYEPPMQFLYTDRLAYLPGETVYLFGMVRFPDKSALDKVYVKMDRWDQSEAAKQAAPILTLPVDPNGSFKLTVPETWLQNIEGYTRLTIGSDQGFVGSTSFEIVNFEKPEVSITLSLEDPLIGPDEPIRFKGDVRHMDDTPMRDYGVKLSSYTLDFDPDQSTLNTDEFGQFQGALKPIYNKAQGYTGPQWMQVNATGIAVENVVPQTYSELVYYASPIILRATHEKVGDEIVFTAKANALKVPDNIEDAFDEATYTGDPLSLEVDYSIEESYYEAQADGQVYDPILKVNVQKYTYTYKSTRVESGRLAIHEGRAQVAYKALEGRSYTLKLVGTLEDGRAIIAETYFYGPVANEPRESLDALGIEDDALKHLLMTPDALPRLPDTYTFELGKAFTLDLAIPEPLKNITRPEHAKTLFILYDHHYLQHQVVSGLTPSFKGTLTEANLPSATLKSVFYDGFRFQNSGAPQTCTLFLDPKDKSLSVGIETEKAVYKPGETVRGTLSIDSPNPMTGTTAWLTVVDKAYLALYPEARDARSEFYSPHYRTGVSWHFQSANNYLMPMGEMGEGGAEGGLIREDFKNTALAIALKLDQEGRGSFSFELPHNITSWRLAAHAIDASGAIGTHYHTISARLPFYLRYLYAPKFTVKDQPILLLSGRSSDGNLQEMHYAWSLSKDSITTAEGKSTDAVSINRQSPIEIGALALGNYDLFLKGSPKDAGTLSDQVKLPIRIVDSAVQFPAVKAGLIDVNNPYTAIANTSNIALTLWHPEAERWRKSLEALTYGSPKRLELYLASILSQYLLEGASLAEISTLLEGDRLVQFEDQLGNFSGVYKPLVNAQPSLQLTADTVTVLADYHKNRGGFAEQFGTYSRDLQDLDQEIEGLRIRAALNQPVLYDLYKVSEKTLDAHQRLSLAWAFITIGDLEVARSQWDLLKESLAMTSQDPVRLKYLRAIVANHLKLAQAEELYSQALDATPKKHSYQLLQFYYLAHTADKLKPITISARLVNSSGDPIEEASYTISTHDPYLVLLEKGTQITLSQNEEPLHFSQHFTGTLANMTFDTGPFSIERSYSQERIALNQTIEVSVLVDGPQNRNFSLIETIPTGFTALVKEGVVRGNQIHFYPENPSGKNTFRYTLKPRLAGAFAMEPSILIGATDPEVTVNQPLYQKGQEVLLHVAP